MSIRQKLTILFLTVGILPTVLITFIAYTTVGGQLTDRAVEQIGSIAARQEQRAEALLQSKREEAVRLAGAQYDLQNALRSYLDSGQRQQGRLTEITDFLLERKGELAFIDNVYITGADGTVIAATAASTVGKQLGEAYTYTARTPSTTRLLEDATDGIDKLYVTTRLPVGGQDVATLAMVYKLNDFTEITDDVASLGDTGETLLARANESGGLVPLFGLRFDDQAAGSTLLDELASVSETDTFAERTDYRGNSVIIATRPIEGTDWILATKIDTAEALAPVTSLRNNGLALIGGLALAVLVLGIFLARSFTAPIRLLTQKTQAVMRGDLTQRIDAKSSDETGILARAFNDMTSQLQQLYQSLEQKVLARTRELEAAQTRLKESIKQDEALLASIGDGVIATDAAGFIVWMNDTAADMLKLSKSEVIGKRFENIWRLESLKSIPGTIELPIAQAVRTGRTIRSSDFDYVRRDQAGNELVRFAAAVTVAPVLMDGNTIGTINVFRDISHERQVDRMKTEFISLASHQLRTPLSAIRWFTEMLLNGDAGKLSPDQQDFARNVYDSAERMTQLVGSLLNISRIESGRIIVDPKPTDLSALINGIVNDLKAKTEEKQQMLVVSVHKDLPKVNLDPRLISQVYMNFLTNAIKYTPKGGEISVFVSRKGNDLLSQVTDTGYGIPLNQQNRVFQKFFRAQNVAKMETDGTGLGLYLVKAIIESSGGRVWFKSESNKGTTFWFTLPMSGMKPREGEVTLDG
jgi:PAS domain S-box-containing protein